MNRLGVDLENYPSPANLAPHSHSPVMRGALQIAIGNSGVIQAVGFTAACIYQFTVGGSPFHAIFRKWCTLIPCHLARFGVRFLLFQRGKTRRLLRFSFGVIAEKQSLELQHSSNHSLKRRKLRNGLQLASLKNSQRSNTTRLQSRVPS
jgi:hypothetical protein